MTKKKSLTKNYIYNASYQVLALITPLITTPYLSRVLEADGIGVYSFTTSIVSYFTMFGVLGTLSYGNREIAYLQEDRKTRSKVFWEVEFLSVITAVIALVAYLFFILFFAKEYHVIYLIQMISFLTIALDITWLLQAMEEFGKIVGRNLFFKILSIAYVFAFVRTKEDLILHVAGNVIISFLIQASVWVYVPQYVDAPDWKNLKPFRHLKGVIALFIPTIAISIYTVLDKTMIGIFSTPYENGYYEQALNLSRTVLSLITALGAVMLPRLGYHYNRGEKEEVNNLMYQSYRFVWFLGIPLCFGLMGVAGNIVPWFYGDGFLKLTVLLPVLSMLIPIVGLSNITGTQYLIVTKREKLLTLSVALGAGVNFLCNIILIPKFSAIGAATASIIAELLITSIQFVFIRKEISVAKILTCSWKYFLAGGMMLVVLIMENAKLTSSILNTGIMVVSGAFVYFAILLLLRDEFLWGYIKKILHK